MGLKFVNQVLFQLTTACILFGNIYAQNAPNIILFLVDDMGWQDCSVPFWDSMTLNNYVFETPNLERLARKGVKFTNAYSNPVCTPSRISIMTGMNVARHGVTNWTNVKKDTPTDYPDSILNPPLWNYNGISSFQATYLPALLKKVGYKTIHCGKGHFGPNGTFGGDPKDLGFDINISGTGAGHPGSFLASDKYRRNENDSIWGVRDLDEQVKEGLFLTDALTQRALQELDGEMPFFLYLSHYAVHLPFSADERFYQKYIEKGLTDTEARYAGLVEGMDKSLGDILNYLEEEGKAESTYIIFMSDNGGLSLSPLRSGESHTQNYPLKMGKGSLYEGGIRVPFLVSGPGINEGGKSSHQILPEDIFPTILFWAGIEKPEIIQKMDGKNITNPPEETENKVLIWHYPNNWTSVNQKGISWASAIRVGDWKLIYFHKYEKLELYNLELDIKEENNLAYTHLDKLKELSIQLTDSLKERDARMPNYKTTGKQVPWPNELVNEYKRPNIFFILADDLWYRDFNIFGEKNNYLFTLPKSIEKTFFGVRKEEGNYNDLSYYASRKGAFKILQNNPFEAFKLYNLEWDPFEQNPLNAEQYPIYEKLKKSLMIHIQKSGKVPWQSSN